MLRWKLLPWNFVYRNELIGIDKNNKLSKQLFCVSGSKESHPAELKLD